MAEAADQADAALESKGTVAARDWPSLRGPRRTSRRRRRSVIRASMTAYDEKIAVREAKTKHRLVTAAEFFNGDPIVHARTHSSKRHVLSKARRLLHVSVKRRTPKASCGCVQQIVQFRTEWRLPQFAREHAYKRQGCGQLSGRHRPRHRKVHALVKDVRIGPVRICAGVPSNGHPTAILGPCRSHGSRPQRRGWTCRSSEVRTQAYRKPVPLNLELGHHLVVRHDGVKSRGPGSISASNGLEQKERLSRLFP
jgi:hypothetical protein